jgi:ubiquitin C-terminal hydrolase
MTKVNLIPAIEDLQKALGVLDKERLNQDEMTSGKAKMDNRKLTQECRKTLDRLEKEYRRMSRMEDRQQQQQQCRPSLSNEQEQQLEGDQHSDINPQNQPPKMTSEVVLGSIANGFHHSSTAQQQPRTLPGTVVASAAQQKKDVMRLLLARKNMLKSLPSNGKGTSSSPEGEAFFLLDWNWWVQWCRYVDFFYLQMIQQGKSNRNATSSSKHIDNSRLDRVRRVLELFPPGAFLADKSRVFSSQKKVNEIKGGGDDDDDDVDSSEEDFVDPPGVIDNSLLIMKLSNRFYRQWYRRSSNNDGVHQFSLNPNLVRGYHFELIPREVYNALRSWYGEVTPSICRRTTSNHNIVLYPPIIESLHNSATPKGDLSQICSACRALAPGSIKKCKRCMDVQYCDRACQESHWPFHKSACNIIVEARSKHDGKSAIDTRRLLPPDLNGCVGLNQLGNTCFMNSALQSLSHATPLTRFFLSSKFKADLNVDNPLGTGGKLAMAYETVMKDLWMKPGIRCTSPVALKRSIAQFAPRFAGCLQHDAQEFLAYLLDGLHEDLNRIHKAPYIEMPDVTNGDNMAIASAEAWEAHKRRNDSLVLDCFYGQFQSTCVCPQCTRVSVAFDSCNHVSLEIPQQEAPIAVSVFVHFADGAKNTRRFGITINRQCPISELKKRVGELSNVSATNLILAGVVQHRIVNLYQDGNYPVASLGRCDILAYEATPTDNKGAVHAIVSHSLIFQSNESASNKMMDKDYGSSMELQDSNGHLERRKMGIPFITSLSKESTCGDLRRTIWRLVRRMIVLAKEGTVPPESTNEEIIDAFEKNRLCDVLTVRVVDCDEWPIQVPTGGDQGTMSSILPDDPGTTLVEWLGEACTESFLFLLLEWKNPTNADSMVIDVNRFEDVEVDSSWHEVEELQRLRLQNGNSVTLNQCFQSFSKPERLDERNKWYCSTCKVEVRALKTIKLWRLPNILVIHLKRFEFRHGFRRDKLDTFVEFPLENLDMEPHAANLGNVSDDNSFIHNRVPAQYDLFAVVNHYGRMGFGHYTAFARQWNEAGMSDMWHLFDDSSVREASESEVKSQSAYILFYRRRQFH